LLQAHTAPKHEPNQLQSPTPAAALTFINDHAKEENAESQVAYSWPIQHQNMSPINWKAHSIVTDVYQECTASQSPKPSKTSAAPAPATWISKTTQDPSSRRLIWNLPEAPENDPQAKRFCHHGRGSTPRLPRCCAKEVPAEMSNGICVQNEAVDSYLRLSAPMVAASKKASNAISV
jgi:hypothetical protein